MNTYLFISANIFAPLTVLSALFMRYGTIPDLIVIKANFTPCGLSNEPTDAYFDAGIDIQSEQSEQMRIYQ